MTSFWLEHEENGQTREFPFNSNHISIGREKSAGFVLDHPTVSRQHAVISHKQGAFYLQVLSQNGLTALDGRQVHGEVELNDKSVIQIGQLKFRFRSDQAASGREPLGASPELDESNWADYSVDGHAGTGSSKDLGSSSRGAGISGQSSEDYANSYTLDSMSDGERFRKEAGIVSWDEIASSSEAMDGPDERPQQTIHQRMQASKEEKTNPLLVLLALAAIGGLIYYSFFYDTAGQVDQGQDRIPFDERPTVEIDVECLGVSACTQSAHRAYKVGIEKLEQHNVAVTNRFEGYKKLLEVEEYLEKAGVDELPEAMANLPERRETARAELDREFRNYRLEFLKAQARKEHHNMAVNLQIIQQLFPDSTAREYLWAAEEIREMKGQGIYPRNF